MPGRGSSRCKGLGQRRKRRRRSRKRRKMRRRRQKATVAGVETARLEG